LDKEGNKIKFLENRLNNQNNVGNISTDFIPLKEKENEKIIKTQMIILPPSKYFSKFYKKSKNIKSKKKKNQNELKIEMFLNKKRNSSSNNSNLSHYSDKSSKTKNTKDENNSALFSAKNLSNYNYLFNFRNNNKNKVKFEYNQKNANKQINSNFNVYLSNKNNNNTLKSKTLFDYFKTTSLRKNDVDNQNKQEIIKEKKKEMNELINYPKNENAVKEKNSNTKHIRSLINIQLILKGIEKRTVVRLHPIPQYYSSFDVSKLIDQYLHIEKGKNQRIYKALYVPLSKTIGKNIGFCFIMMVEPKYVIDFYTTFNGITFNKKKSRKPCTVIWADVQGDDFLKISDDPLRSPIIFKDLIDNK
jgi:hypothetical protein